MDDARGRPTDNVRGRPLARRRSPVSWHHRSRRESSPHRPLQHRTSGTEGGTRGEGSRQAQVFLPQPPALVVPTPGGPVHSLPYKLADLSAVLSLAAHIVASAAAYGAPSTPSAIPAAVALFSQHVHVADRATLAPPSNPPPPPALPGTLPPKEDAAPEQPLPDAPSRKGAASSEPSVPPEDKRPRHEDTTSQPPVTPLSPSSANTISDTPPNSASDLAPRAGASAMDKS